MSSEWDHARLPKTYTAAARALEKCSTYDECVEWKNIGQAMASYARQMNDTTLEKRGIEIKERAKKRFGQLSNDRTPQSGGDRRSRGVAPPLGRQAAARAVGVNDTERKEAQRLAKMPEEKFEAHIAQQKCRVDEPRRSPQPKYIRPSAVAEAVEVIAGARGFGEIDRSDVDRIFKLAEKAIRNLTKWAIMLKTMH
jgi:hypothetical protein